VHATKEIAMSESTEDEQANGGREETDEGQKPGESDTETEGGFPKEGGDSGESAQDE
jgi:hypothetical protein